VPDKHGKERERESSVDEERNEKEDLRSRNVGL